MRFLHDAARRQSIVAAGLALTLAMLDLIASQAWAQTNGTDRLPATTRPAAGSAPPRHGTLRAGRAGTPAARVAAAPGTAARRKHCARCGKPAADKPRRTRRGESCGSCRRRAAGSRRAASS